jgi:ribosomal protein S18 acetylase RimI-like enzyme
VVTIRTGAVADAEAVLALWSEGATVASSTDDADGITRLLGHEPNALLLAEVDGELVGSVIVGWDGWRATMYRLVVAPSARRQGIATRLVDEGEQWLREQGARRFHLIVDTDEQPARAFWRSVGYTETPQHRLVKTLRR